MEKESDAITRATALLSTLLHCRKQAESLRKCKRSSVDSSTRHAPSCEAEQSAFKTCSQEHIGLVIEHLVKIADTHCPNEVEALQRCRLVRPGDDCEFEDMDAMRCASIRVLQAASAPPAASRRA